MENNISKHQIQRRLIVALKDFAGSVCSGFANQKEFFIFSLENISANLMELKTESLKDLAAEFAAKRERGPVSDEELAEFKDSLDKLVSARDFDFICAALPGSLALLKERLVSARPLSMAAEEKKGLSGARDASAYRLITDTYKHLRFWELEEQAAKRCDDIAVEHILTRARADVAEYCSLYKVPLNPADTLTNFSMARIDAVAAACFRLLANIRDLGAAGRK
jgi:hypothetical protein